MRSTPERAGDEPFELACLLRGRAAVISDRDRVSAAEWAAEELNPTVYLLDDAFQHRRAARDLDVLVIDGTNPFDNGKLLPAGKLREELSNIRRADAIVLSKTHLVESTDETVNEIRTHAPDVPVFRSSSQFRGLRTLADFSNGVENFEMAKNTPVLLFCGLGNPDSFFDHASEEGLDVRGSHAFPDHQSYSDHEFRLIEEKAMEVGAESVICTGKDAVKIPHDALALECLVFESHLTFENEQGFTDLVDKVTGADADPRSGDPKSS